MASTGFHSPPWHEDERTPIVDNKIISRNTGELLPGNGAGYLGPPAVDIVISNIHCDAEGYVSRNTRAFPVEKLLWQVMKVIEANDLEILSINVTTYSINVMLAHPATPSQMREWSDRMANGIWEPEVEDAVIRKKVDIANQDSESKLKQKEAALKEESSK